MPKEIQISSKLTIAPDRLLIAYGTTTGIAAGTVVAGAVLDKNNIPLAMGRMLTSTKHETRWYLHFPNLVGQVNEVDDYTLIVWLKHDRSVFKSKRLKFKRIGFGVNILGPNTNDNIETTTVAFGTRDEDDPLTGEMQRTGGTAASNKSGEWLDTGVPSDWVYIFRDLTVGTIYSLVVTGAASSDHKDNLTVA